MISILNSISLGDLRVQDVPGVTPKPSSVVDILQNSEIEFKTCPKLPDSLQNFNTGFGENQDLHYTITCHKPELNTPLYKENYLQEFTTEEEKAAVRNALGLYNRADVVTMSLVTTDDTIPTPDELTKATIKQFKKSDTLFFPVTSESAVFDSYGIPLNYKLKIIENTGAEVKQDLLTITQLSKSSTISSLGDVQLFLKGFDKEDTLKDTIETITRDSIRFEIIGQIN